MVCVIGFHICGGRVICGGAVFADWISGVWLEGFVTDVTEVENEFFFGFLDSAVRVGEGFVCLPLDGAGGFALCLSHPQLAVDGGENLLGVEGGVYGRKGFCAHGEQLVDRHIAEPDGLLCSSHCLCR